MGVLAPRPEFLNAFFFPPKKIKINKFSIFWSIPGQLHLIPIVGVVLITLISAW